MAKVLADLYKAYRHTEALAKAIYGKTKSIPTSNAVLLIDMQDDFLEDIKENKREEMISSQLEVLSRCTEHRIPVFVLEYRAHGKTTEVLREKVREIPLFYHITKDFNNGFAYTYLEIILKKLGLDTLYLMGINASCVTATADGALENGFKISTSKKVVADGGEDGWIERYISLFKEKGTYYEDLESLIRCLTST